MIEIAPKNPMAQVIGTGEGWQSDSIAYLQSDQEREVLRLHTPGGMIIKKDEQEDDSVTLAPSYFEETSTFGGSEVPLTYKSQRRFNHLHHSKATFLPKLRRGDSLQIPDVLEIMSESDTSVYTLQEKGISIAATKNRLKPLLRQMPMRLFPIENKYDRTDAYNTGTLYKPALRLIKSNVKPNGPAFEKPILTPPVSFSFVPTAPKQSRENDTTDLKKQDEYLKSMSSFSTMLLDEIDANQHLQISGWVIMINRGKVQTDSPSYRKLESTAESRGILIALEWLLSRIASMMSEYSVSTAEINCLSVLEFAAKPDLYPFQRHRIWSLIGNREEIEKLIYAPGQRFKGEIGKLASVIRIQSIVKRYHDRIIHRVNIKRLHAVQTFQKFWAQRNIIMKLRIRMREKRATDVKAFNRLRSNMKRDNQQIFRYSRTIIYVLERNDTCLSDLDFGRILWLQDPMITLVLVVPSITPQQTTYYKTLAEKSVLGKNPMTSGRLKIIIPENIGFIPTTSTVAQCVLFSFKALRQLKSLCLGVTALLCCDTLDQSIMSLSTALNIPYLGPSMEAYQKLFGHDQKLLHESSVHKLNTIDLRGKTSEDEILFTIAKACLRFTDISTWNIYFCSRKPSCDESYLPLPSATFHSGGIMSNDFGDTMGKRKSRVGSVVPRTSMVRRPSDESESDKMLRPPTLTRRRRSTLKKDQVQKEEIPMILKLEIRDNIQGVDSYYGWDSTRVFKEILENGGYMEENPSNQVETYRVIEVAVHVDATVSKIVIQEGMSLATFVPQQSIDHDLLKRQVTQLARTCTAKDIYGLVTVTFYTWLDTTKIPESFRAMAKHVQPGLSLGIKRALCSMVQAGSTFNSETWDMEYSRVEIPLKLSHIKDLRYLDKARLNIQFKKLLPISPKRVMFMSDTLSLDLVQVISRKAALARLEKNGVLFDSWKCTGVLFPSWGIHGPKYLSMICVDTSLECLYISLMNTLISIEKNLDAKLTPLPNNLAETASCILKEQSTRSGILRHAESGEILTSIPDLSPETETYESTFQLDDLSPLEQILYGHVPFPIQPNLKKRLKTPGTDISISSGTVLLLQEGIPSQKASEKDPTFYKPDYTPPETRKQRKKSIANKLFTTPSEKEEARTLALLETLELAVDEETNPELNSAQHVILNVPWHTLAKDPPKSALDAISLIKRGPSPTVKPGSRKSRKSSEVKSKKPVKLVLVDE